MNRQRRNSKLITPAFFTVLAWLAGFLVLSSCSTGNHSAQLENSKEAAPVNHALQKKQKFFAFMKPIVISENERILQQRKTLLRLKSASRLTHAQSQQLKQIASEYGLDVMAAPDARMSDKNWMELLARVDVVPLDMALVQAANESAWGTSRFARQGNNYFGQWCYQKGCGIVPKHRSAGATHEVQKFSNATHSVRAYMHNINTTRAYAEFHHIRQHLRARNRPLDAEVLVVGLKSYSERGQAYVRIIQAMIRKNRSLISQS